MRDRSSTPRDYEYPVESQKKTPSTTLCHGNLQVLIFTEATEDAISNKGTV